MLLMAWSLIFYQNSAVTELIFVYMPCRRVCHLTSTGCVSYCVLYVCICLVGECVISRQLAASVIACCFLGLFPRFSNIRANFDEVLINMDRYLLCAHYLWKGYLVAVNTMYFIN